MDINVYAQQLNVSRSADGTRPGLRSTRDGSAIILPWYQALVLEGRVFGIHAGSITTPIAGHAAIDADQPEAAVMIPDGTTGIPLYVNAAMETGPTTLAQGGMMTAVSNIEVGAGTSTAATPFNLNLANPVATAATARVAYTGNGTDPLTAGNFLELARVSAVIDADAATSGIIPPVLRWSPLSDTVAPLIQDSGSFLLYGEAAANTLFGTLIWAELPESAFQ